MLVLLLAEVSLAVTLPGIPIPFDVDDGGQWVLGAELPENIVAAGAAPGWVLTAVDDVAFEDPSGIARNIAAGPQREVRLRFEIPPERRNADPEEAILVVARSPLVYVEPLGVLPWPEGFPGSPSGWLEDGYGHPVVGTADGGWLLDPATGILGPSTGPDDQEASIPPVFWNLSDATWVVDQGDEVVQLGAGEAAETLGEVARIRSFQGRSGDHLLAATDAGLEVMMVSWPRGTPSLPVCASRIPESCLTGGKRVASELSERPGGLDEALRQLGAACAGGVYRACYEAVALEDGAMADQAMSCVEGEVLDCTAVARQRFELQPEEPDDVVVGLLEYACEQEGSGTLGERLRRLEDIGAGCMMLSEAYDARSMPDRALLNLDQACVLGRAEACEMATERRYQAFAARTIRECEDEDTPIAASCVQLGGLLQENPIPGTGLDEFGAFLRGCSLGAADGCLALGDYVDRWGITNERVVTAERELRSSCDSGEQRACLGAGHLLVRHEPKSEAYGEALVLFDGACASGLAPACLAGAQQRRIGAAKKLEASSQIDMWGSGCDLQHAEACYGLGERYERKKPEWPMAFAAWTSACELGDATSCSQLGKLVERPHDPAWQGEQPVLSYLEKGCNSGDPEGCFWLAEYDLPRKGEPAEDAYLLLDQSCDGEYGPGCARLAGVHIDRKSSFDDEIAARHLDTACEAGHFDSCRLLGTMYLRGKGVDRDKQRANELLERFRLNAPRKHVRLGGQIGLMHLAGGEGELVVPIPVGPALSLGGAYSYVPKMGSFLAMLKGESKPVDAPDYQFLGGTIRLYPNTQARGAYGAVGMHQLVASGGSLQGRRVRRGFNARVGFRTDNKGLFTGMEFGLGQYGMFYLRDFDDNETGSFPVLLPTFSLSAGVAFL